jgi:hypothetical protein
MWMVPHAVNTPQAIALARGKDAEVVTNWKCSVVLLVLVLVLALAAVMLLPATTAANASAPAAAPKALRMITPVR